MKDNLDILEWAKTQADILRLEILSKIKDGWNKEKALETTLNSSTIGNGFKAQIRYEMKNK